jgi:hypothetical protein
VVNTVFNKFFLVSIIFIIYGSIWAGDNILPDEAIVIANSSKEIAYKHSSGVQLNALARERAEMLCKSLRGSYESHEVRELKHNEPPSQMDVLRHPHVSALVVNNSDGEFRVRETEVKFYRPWSYFTNEKLTNREELSLLEAGAWTVLQATTLVMGGAYMVIQSVLNPEQISKIFSSEITQFPLYTQIGLGISAGIMVVIFPKMLTNIRNNATITYQYAKQYFSHRELSAKEVADNISLGKEVYAGYFLNEDYVPHRIFTKIVCNDIDFLNSDD